VGLESITRALFRPRSPSPALHLRRPNGVFSGPSLPKRVGFGGAASGSWSGSWRSAGSRPA